MNSHRPFVLFVMLSLPVAALAQDPEAGLVALHQALLDATTDAVVLNIAAHPDDESSRTNTILRRKYGMRVVTAYTTYGDGGQNAIGREIGPELAGLRVRETLRAAAISGVDVRWLGMPDFGFSKTLEETLAVWGEQQLLAAMRELVRAVDPDVVITNHNLTEGHGHHRASFWAVREVLRERAVKGEHAAPLYSRCSIEKAQATMDPGELDPAHGETYAAMSYRAWTQHVTQGPWGPHNPLNVGKDWWHVVLPEGTAAERAADLRSWVRDDAAGAGLPADAARLPRDELTKVARETLLSTRARLGAVTADLGAPGALRQASLLHHRARTLERILQALANVRIETWLADDVVAAGGRSTVHVVVHGVAAVGDLQVRCNGVDAVPAQVPIRQTFAELLTPVLPDALADPAVPAPTNGSGDPPPKTHAVAGRLVVPFTAETAEDGAAPEGPEPQSVDVDVSFTLDGVPFQLVRTLTYTSVAPIELRWDRDVLLVPKGPVVERQLTVAAKSHRGTNVNDAVRLSMGFGLQATSTPGWLALSREHDEARILVRATIDPQELDANSGLEVGFRGAASRLRVQLVDVTVPADLRVALIRGPDDSTERTLADLGVRFEALDRDGLLTARLQDFSTVLLDIRAYHHRPELAELRDRLLQYCRAGGRIVAMYHKPGEWNERAGHPLLAPFPLVVGDARATDENAPVKLLQPEHRLLQHPHAIGEADFAGWIQERGLNFPKTWDPAWTPLLELKDTSDEKAHQGALLHTQFGRGDFVYCSLAIYRQLRNGNTGAVRLLINLLAR